MILVPESPPLSICESYVPRMPQGTSQGPSPSWSLKEPVLGLMEGEVEVWAPPSSACTTWLLGLSSAPPQASLPPAPAQCLCGLPGPHGALAPSSLWLLGPGRSSSTRLTYN